MNSDLIVMTFEDDEMARTVNDSLRAMRKSRVLGLDDTAVVTKDGNGQVRLHPGPQACTGLATLLADFLFPSPGTDVQVGSGDGLDGEFVATVGSALRKSGSALLFFVNPDGLSDASEVLNALALFRGTIHQTTLSPQSEALLRGLR